MTEHDALIIALEKQIAQAKAKYRMLRFKAFLQGVMILMVMVFSAVVALFTATCVVVATLKLLGVINAGT